MDQFAQIAANGIGGNAALLEPVTPIPHETVICRLEQADAQPIAVKPFFAEVCNNCHFMHPQAAWEQTDKTEKLRMACAELEDERT